MTNSNTLTLHADRLASPIARSIAYTMIALHDADPHFATDAIIDALATLLIPTLNAESITPTDAHLLLDIADDIDPLLFAELRDTMRDNSELLLPMITRLARGQN